MLPTSAVKDSPIVDTDSDEGSTSLSTVSSMPKPCADVDHIICW